MLPKSKHSDVANQFTREERQRRHTWVTLVRSRQSMQLALTTPLCSWSIAPSELIRKYLLSWHNNELKKDITCNYYKCIPSNQKCIQRANMYNSHKNNILPNLITLVFQHLRRFDHRGVADYQSCPCHRSDGSRKKHICNIIVSKLTDDNGQ